MEGRKVSSGRKEGRIVKGRKKERKGSRRKGGGRKRGRKEAWDF